MSTSGQQGNRVTKDPQTKEQDNSQIPVLCRCKRFRGYKPRRRYQAEIALIQFRTRRRAYRGGNRRARAVQARPIEGTNSTACHTNRRPRAAACNKVGSVRVDFTCVRDIIARAGVGIAHNAATSRARRSRRAGRSCGNRGRSGEDGLHEERRACL